MGLLGLVGTAHLGLAEDADAKKKGKKGKKKPKTCAKLAEGAACGKRGRGVCTHGACGRPCAFNDGQCPEGTICPIESTVCVSDSFCERPCAADTECDVGEICMATSDCGAVCGRVAPV